MVLALYDSEAIDLVSLSFCGAIKVFGNLVFSFKDDFLIFDLSYPEATEAIFLISWIWDKLTLKRSSIGYRQNIPILSFPFFGCAMCLGYTVSFYMSKLYWLT